MLRIHKNNKPNVDFRLYVNVATIVSCKWSYRKWHRAYLLRSIKRTDVWMHGLWWSDSASQFCLHGPLIAHNFPIDSIATYPIMIPPPPSIRIALYANILFATLKCSLATDIGIRKLFIDYEKLKKKKKPTNYANLHYGLCVKNCIIITHLFAIYQWDTL